MLPVMDSENEISAKGRSDHIKSAARSAAWRPYPTADTTRHHDTVMAQVIRYIAPWRRWEYRGIKATIREVVGYPITATCIQDWRSGRRNPSPEFLEKFAARLEMLAVVAASLAAAVRDMLPHSYARQRRPRGFCVVRDRDGTGMLRDGRGRGARPKKGN
jgi:hypothetical protein